MANHLLHSANPVVLGKRLAEARYARNLTLQQAAVEIGVAPSRMADLENGVHLPRVTEFVKLATLCGRPVIEFVGDGNQSLLRLGNDRTQQSIETAVQAHVAGDLTEVELARWLGIDIVSMREFIQQLGTGAPWDMERLEKLRSKHQERIKPLLDFAAGFADLSAEEIECETARALAEVRAEQRALTEEERR